MCLAYLGVGCVHVRWIVFHAQVELSNVRGSCMTTWITFNLHMSTFSSTVVDRGFGQYFIEVRAQIFFA